VRKLADSGAAGLLLPRLYPAGQHRGHKRDHLDWLMGHVPGWVEHFGDGFGGTCIVGWHAKRRDLRVLINDVMAFSHLRARALIVNGRVRLHGQDVDVLDEPNRFRLRVAREWYGPAVGAANADWFDNLAANLHRLDDPVKRDVAACAAITCLMRRMNYPQVTFAHDRRFTGRRHLEGFDWGREFRRHALDEFPLLLHDNGMANEACRGDALEFVRSHRFDCLYLDPPFASATKYETDLAFYDKLCLILEGRHGLIDAPFNGPVPLPPHTCFSNRHRGLMGLNRLFRAAAHVPRIILSYNSTSGIHPDELARDGERIYGRLVAREERPAALSTVRADRPRHTRDVLLVFERR
jgi:hypothetical protein